MLQGRFATKQTEARYPTLWNGLVAAFAPCITGPTGLRLLNFGRGGDGTLTNMDAPTDWVRSQGQYCLDFDGTNDLVVSTRSVSFPFTMSGWVCSDSATAVQTVCSFGSTSATTPFAIIRLRGDLAGDPFEAVYYGTAENLAQSSTGYTVGRWHHVTGVFINASLVRLYVDGKLATTATTAGGTGTFNVFSIGALRRTTDIHFTDGKIDDVRIYNRALSASEIALLARRRGIAYEPIPRHRRLVSRIVDPQPTAAAESTGFVAAYPIRKLLRGQYATRKQDAYFPSLWEGCVYAACPSVTGPTGLKLFDFSRGNTGTLTNMDSAGDWVRSQGQYCLDFDGTDDYVSTSTLKINPTNSFSIAAWVYADSLALEGGSDRCVVAQTNGTGTGRALLYIDNASSKAACFLGGVLTVGPTVLSTGQWYHIAVTYNKSTGNVTVYTNGVAGTPAARTPGAADGNLVIGVQKDLTNGNFDGLIDDIRIYTKSQTASEISTLAKSRAIAYKPKRDTRVIHSVTFPAETFTGPYIHIKRTKLLAGKYAIRKEDAKYPQLLEGRVGAWCPSITGPTGLKLFDFARSNTGTLTNMDAAGDWVRSEGRYALDFDGVNDRVALTSPNIFRNTGHYSISVWAYARSTSLEKDIFTQKTTNVGYNRFSLRNNAGKMRVVATTAANEPTGAETILASTTSITTNTWQHWCGVITPGYFYIYLNGVLDNSASNSFVAFASTVSANANIGQGFFSNGNNNLWDGQLDDIAIYNRVLSPTEIRILSRSRGIAYTPKQKQYQPHNFAAVAATMSRLLMLRRKAALQCY